MIKRDLTRPIIRCLKNARFPNIDMKIVAIIPIKHHSSRIPGKNRCSFNGQPLYEIIINTLKQVDDISSIIINTDCPIIKGEVRGKYPDIIIYDRPEELCGDHVSTNNLLLDTADSLSILDDTILLQTHVTNPLLSKETIESAISTFVNDNEHDSLFGVNVHHTRLYDKDGRAMNHDVDVLIRTQDLDPIFEENSCIYLFTAKILREKRRRIGDSPILFPIDRVEAQDIDWKDDLILARLLGRMKKREGKVVLVTGSDGGIGTAICRLFYEEGWQVLAVDREETNHNHHTERIIEDITNYEKMATLMGRIRDEYGGLDCLVNNAAYQVCEPLNNTTEKDWDDVMDVNLKAPFMIGKIFHPLLKVKTGSIVNVSSIHSLATSKGIAAYGVSKSALSGLTRTMAIEYAEDNIRVNAVVPGAIETEMLKEHLTERRMVALRERHPKKEIGRPEDVAQAVYFLADNDCSNFITGENLVIDGGISITLASEV